MAKKAELSINFIIIAVICLVVLAIIIAIFAGKTGMFSKSVSGCQLGVQCRGGETTCQPGEYQVGVCRVKQWGSEPVDGVCCKNTVELEGGG